MLLQVVIIAEADRGESKTSTELPADWKTTEKTTTRKQQQRTETKTKTLKKQKSRSENKAK